MTDVKITVLMPVYNAAGYIAEAIESVLLQTFRDFELLIVNDGSTDGTTNVIRSFNDDRIVLIEQENQGVAAALNNGLRHARADYIARFDADDICYPERLEKQYHFIRSNPDYIVVGSAADYMDATGNYIFTHHPHAITNEQLQNLSYTTCPFIHASVIYKKNVIADVGYNIKSKGKMYNLPDRLISVRLNPASLTMDERKRPKEFHEIKIKALKTGNISKADGDRLLNIILEQNNSKNKEGAYYILLAKKFLWNNYDPSKARQNLVKAIKLNSFDIRDYMLLLISYLPKNMINNMYSIFVAAK
jgi:glycosyltransferase involved in cell wall biosynthesis